jgi:subtilisin
MTISQRQNRYLIGKPQNVPASTTPVDLSNVKRMIEADPDIELLSVIGDGGSLTPLGSTGGSTEPKLLVVEMSSDRAENLKEDFGDAIIIEPNSPLTLFPAAPSLDFESTLTPFVSPLDDILRLTLVVTTGTPSRPVADAQVALKGSLWVDKGTTDKDGKVELEMRGETKSTLQGLYVSPRSNYWSFWVSNPVIEPGKENSVFLSPLEDSFPSFPTDEILGWGHQALELDKLKKDLRGRGIKIAVIDSGLFNDHDDLQAKGGFDFTEGSSNPKDTWTQDKLGHGSHVAGVIAALHNSQGIKGFVPEAEVYSLKIFPGGRNSDLVNSIKECVALGVDIVNMSIGTEERSELVYQEIQNLREQGIACIAAVGNSGGAVQYPAAFPEVLGVSAVGKKGTFPENSYHSQQIGEFKSTDGLYFSAKFTCFGDGVDVCAPGVAIVSCVPTSTLDYVAWDGTSMACPHVTGLAALILEANDSIRTMARDSRRVDALFEVIKNSAQDLGLPKSHQGVGMPNLSKAIP